MVKKYGLMQNSIYVMGSVWKHNRLILPLIAVNTFVTAVSPFIGILFPRQILDELLTAKRPERLALLLAAFFLTAVAAAYFTQYLRGVFMAQPVKVIKPHVNQMYQKCMDISFQCTEDPDFLNNVRTAEKGCGWSNYNGVSGMLHKWFEAPGAVIALCGYIAIVSKLSIFIRLYLFFCVGVNYVLSLAQKKYEHGSRFLFYRGRVRGIKESVKNFEMISSWVGILLSLVREGIVYAYLVHMVAEGRMTIADFTMYAAAIAGFSGAFDRVAGCLAEMNRLSMQISDYRTFMSWPDEMAEAEEKVSIPPGPYEFEFRNVSWKYPGGSRYVFQNLNLKISKGQRLALVGHNGAGKSTLVKLLLRLYDVTEGKILCNGINIKKFDRGEYYGLFSAVFQEVIPLGFSVADNIGISEAGRIDRQRVDQCIGRAGLSDKIHSLKHGADTCVLKALDDEGIEFSGGEKQKLMIARALYKDGVELSGGEMQKLAIARVLYHDAPLMVLDEPTAALDPYSEYEVYAHFDRMTDGKTAIYISHRLSSCRFCDAVAVFDNGELVEYGSHGQLAAGGGLYAEMWEAQAQYYQ